MKSFIPILGLTFLTVISSCSNRDEITVKESQYPTFYGAMTSPVGEIGTRAYVSEVNKVYLGNWNKNDNLSIFYGNTYNKKYYYEGSSGTTSGEFKPVGGSDGLNGGVAILTELNYAIYPYDAYNACQQADGTLIVPFPKERTINTNLELEADDIGASIMLVAKSETTKLPFKHVAGYYGFRLYGEGVSVSSITMRSNSGEPLSGSANVIYDENDNLTVSFVNRDHEDDPTCTFNYSPAVALGATAEEFKMFWITLPPTLLASGITLTVKDANGGERVIKASNITEIEVNKFKAFDPMEIKFDVPTIPVTGITVAPTTLEMIPGNEQVLTATIAPTDATDQNVTWTSSDDNVATVDDNGKVTAVAAGTATITVTTEDGDLTATCEVTVKDVVTYNLVIDPAENAEVNAGSTFTFKLMLTTTTNGVAAEPVDVAADANWTSSDTAVATIAAGVATGIKEGNVTISAKYTTPDGVEKTLTAPLKVNKNPNQAGDDIPIGGGGSF